MEHRIGARVALAITVGLVACSTNEDHASFSERAAAGAGALASSGQVGAASADPGAREAADDTTAPPFAPFTPVSVVTHLGELDLRLPFPDLPARGGPPPSLSLVYGATPADAVRGFGIGFQLDVPALEMAGEGGVPLRSMVAATGDLTVRFQHGPARLVWVAREQVEGCDRVEYRLDFGDERVRFFRFPNGGKRGDGTACFEGFRVAYPDGRQEVYSGDPSIAEGASLPRNGFFPTRWPLQSTISPTGETVSYAYTKAEDGRTYLDAVTFAGGRSRYELARTTRPNTLVSHAAGHPQGARQLYTKLTARFDGDVMHQWCFVYDGGSAGRSRVVTHPDCQELANADFANAEASDSLRRREALVGLYRLGRSPAPFTRATLREPLVRFRYTELRGADLANHQLVYAYPVPDVYGFGPSGGSELFDVDADGVLDVLRFAPGDGVSYPSYGQGDLAAPQAFVRGGAIALEKIVDGAPQPRVLRFDETPQSTSVLLRGDFDGDGRRDLLEASRNGSESQLFLFRGQAGEKPFASPTSSTRVPLDLSRLTMGRAQVVDLNGDGNDDLVALVAGASEPTWTALVNVTQRGEDEATFVSLSEQPLPFRAPRETTLQDPSFRFLDANGDGLTDLAVLKVSGAGDKGLCVYENQGAVTAFAPVRSAKVARGGLVFGAPDATDALCERGVFLPISGLASSQNLNAIWLVDVDRDGVADLVDVAPSADALEVWLGLGREGFAPPRSLPLGTRVSVDPRNKWNTRVLDVDGDGAEEILVYEPGAAGGQIKILDFNRHGLRNAVAPGLLLEVAAGPGHEQSFQYATSTDERVRDLRAAGAAAPPGVPFPVTVVKRISELVSGGPARVRELAYHAPVLDPLTRSFVGFREVTEVEHGDETQESLGTTWAFGPASAGAPEDRYLADRVRHEEVFRPRLSEAQRQRIRESASQWPRDADDASWTDRAWSEEPYVAATTFLKVDRRWALVPVAGVSASSDGTPTFVRLAEERTATCSSDEACATPSLATSETEHDDVWNRLTREVRSLARVPGPHGTELPARSHERRLTYDAAWDARGVGLAVSHEETRVASTGRRLGARSWAYAADRPLPLRVTEAVLVDESTLVALPAEARSLVPTAATRTQVLAYDAHGNVVSTSDDLGAIARTTYDATGVLPVATENALGHTTTFCYGTAGCPIPTTAARLPAHALEPTAVRGPRGDVTLFERDDLHRPLRMLSPSGRETTYAYREAGEREPGLVRVAPRRFTDAEAASRNVDAFVPRVVAFDAAGARLGTARADEHGGARIVGLVARGRRGNVAFEAVPYAAPASPDAIFASGSFPAPAPSCAAGSFACSVHDALGRLVTHTDAPGRWRTKLAYEPWGRRTEEGPTGSPAGAAAPRVRLDVQRTPDEIYAVVDEAAHVHRFERDDMGRVLRTWVAGEAAPRLTVFDSSGDLVVAHAPGGLTRTWIRDARGRVPEERTWDRDFVAHERITRTFDALDRESTVTTATSAREGAWDEQTFTYDAVPDDGGANVGLLVAATTRDHVAGASTTERFSYEATADMAARHLTYDVAGAHREYEERWTYALDGTVVAHVDAVGDAFELTPTPSGAPSRVLWKGAGAAPAELLAGVTYDARGRLATYAVTPTGARRALEHEASTGRLTSARLCVGGAEGPCTAAAALASHDVAYTRHPDGRLASMRTQVEGDPTTSYAYGPRGELVAAQGRAAMAYDYAPRGALQKLDEGVERTFTATDGTTLLPLPEGLVSSLDGFGRLRAVGAVQGITYDPFGRIRRVEESGKTLEYDYTAFGARVAKRVSGGAGGASVVVYPSEATRDDGVERQAIVGLEGRKVAVVVDGRRVLALVDDQRGAPVALVDASGRVVASVDYSPYGKALHVEGGGALASTELAFSFTGQSADPDTGFVHMGAREYAPELASFTSPDPFALGEPELCVASPLECHLYGYAQDDPLNVVDPEGLSGVQGPGGGAPKPRPPQRRPTTNEHRSTGQRPSKHGGRSAQERQQNRSSSGRQAGGAVRGVPRGMGSMKAFEKFSATLREGLEAAGFRGVEPVFQGSAVTGFSYARGYAFDQSKEGLSDWDVALCGAGILGHAKKVGLEIRSNPTRTQPVGLDKAADLRAAEAMGLRPLAEALKQQYGRSVNFMIYENVETAVSRSPSILFPR